MASEDRPVAFVDSSAIVALIDSEDAAHTAAVAAYNELKATGYRLFTTDHVVVETYDLLHAGLGSTVAGRWLRENRLPIYPTDESDLAAAQSILLGRSDDSPMTLPDAISLAVMERLGVADAFAVDPSFLAALT